MHNNSIFHLLHIRNILNFSCFISINSKWWYWTMSLVFDFQFYGYLFLIFFTFCTDCKSLFLLFFIFYLLKRQFSLIMLIIIIYNHLLYNIRINSCWLEVLIVVDLIDSLPFFKLLRRLYYLYKTRQRNSIFIFFRLLFLFLYIHFRNIFFELFLFSIFDL